jgi:HD-like signal output (HDOD) protein/ActR/RegA family two-component response regulator
MLTSNQAGNTMTQSILFVDEERFVHKALKRSFRNMRDDWHMQFAGGPQEAVETLEDQPVDVIVTETVFSSQNGIDFLETVRNLHPESVRIILSGYADQDVILKSVDLAHQYLAKPCEDDTLKATISRAFMVKALLDNTPLKQVVSKIDSLPSVPALYIELVEELQSEDASIANVGDIVAKDMGLTAKILKLVNSAFFGLPQQISSPAKAVSLLGVDLIKAIVLTSGTFDKFKKLTVPGFSLDEMWQHAMSCAACAKMIAQQSGCDRQEADTVFMSGLLHDIGKLLVAAHMPEQYSRFQDHIKQHGTSMADAEMAVIGTTHAAIGGYLLGLWGLPDPIIEATAFHHDPARNPAPVFGITGIVHVADALAHAGPVQKERLDGIDYAYLEATNHMPDLDRWIETCRSAL